MSPNGKLIAHGGKEELVVTDMSSNAQVFSCPAGRRGSFVFHPAQGWLASGGIALCLINMGDQAGVRRIYVGGKSQFHTKASEAARAHLQSLDMEAAAEATRESTQKTIEALRKAASRVNPSADHEKLYESMRRGTEKRLEESRDARRAMDEGTWKPITISNEPVSCMGFSRDGRWLWCGTQQGLRVYDWSSVPRDDGADLMQATWSFPLPDPPHPRSNYVFAVAEEADVPAIVFGGITGTLFRMNLLTGQTSQLLKISESGRIEGLHMSIDGRTLGIATNENFEASKRGVGNIKFTWQVWSYSHLR
jgi:hypothetical protein